jgi:D-glycero-D-manno-heptose 1,7-bisphosphate phosphatase
MTIQPAPSRPAVFLDRDGVINRPIIRQGRPFPPDSLDELEVYPDAAASLRRLQAAGFTLVVVTNQPDVARGKQRREVVHEINRELRRQLPLAAVYVCFHDDADGCRCRKPAPGLLFDAADDLGLDLGRSFMVGDRWRDVEAGRRAGCRTVHIDRHYSERAPECPDVVTTGLAEAVSWIEVRGYGGGRWSGKSGGGVVCG